MDNVTVEDSKEELSIAPAPEAEGMLREMLKLQQDGVAEKSTIACDVLDDNAQLDLPSHSAPSEQGLHLHRRLVKTASASLRQHETSILVYGFVSSALFTLLNGAVAAVALLFWISICILITKLNYLNNSTYRVASSEKGLFFKRQDKIGQSELCIPWANLAEVAEEKSGNARELVLLFKPFALSRITKWVYQDLFDYPLLKERIKLHVDDFTDGQSYNQFRSHIADQCAQNSIACATWLEPYAPLNHDAGQSTDELSHGSISHSVEEKGTAPSTADSDLVVAYNPHRWWQEYMGKFLQKHELLFAALILLVPTAAFCFSGLMIAKTITCVLVIFACWIFCNPLFNEMAQFHFDKEGLALFWKDMASMHLAKPVSSMGPRIPWNSVKRVYIAKKDSAKAQSSTLVITFANGDRKTRSLHLLRFLAPSLIQIRQGAPELHLKTHFISDDKSKRNLFKALCENLSDQVIDPSVRETLNPTDVASYTKLWMDSFNAASRNFDGCLAEGHQLANGEYEIDSFLGAGGQASVYLAKSRSESFAPKVVLKEFILPAHAGADVSKRSLANIQREFDLMQNLQHQNIVKYFGMFVEDHRAYLVLEHVDGSSLRSLVDEHGAMGEAKVLQLAYSMSEILAHLHGQSPAIIHRDFTPENLILGSDGELKLIDFNVAQELETEATKTIVGKHSYLPPEQFRGKAVPQSDIYALGATLHFLLTATEPEPITSSHPIILNDSVSAATDELVSRSTALELDDRYQSAAQLAAAIQCCIRSSDSPAEELV